MNVEKCSVFSSTFARAALIMHLIHPDSTTPGSLFTPSSYTSFEISFLLRSLSLIVQNTLHQLTELANNSGHVLEHSVIFMR